MTDPWTNKTLHDALVGHIERERLPIRVHPGNGGSAMEIELAAYGDMSLHLSASGEQIFVSTPLCHGAEVVDRAAFNDACLRLNPVNPLSNIGLQALADDDVYVVFGELSTRSPLTNIVEAIQALGHNTVQAAEALRTFFRRTAQTS